MIDLVQQKRPKVGRPAFANGGPHKTDLMLVNTGNEDTIFHMIEITRSPRPH